MLNQDVGYQGQHSILHSYFQAALSTLMVVDVN